MKVALFLNGHNSIPTCLPLVPMLSTGIFYEWRLAINIFGYTIMTFTIRAVFFTSGNCGFVQWARSN